ncbi:MAG: pantoate--beta-alanine ligase [Robiginitomaculum sp.]
MVKFIVKSETSLREQVQEWRRAGESIGFVPTMGALHKGHLSLVEKVKEHASKIVASIYVNPTQFAQGEDLDSYPRQVKKDAAMLKAAGCDLVYTPDNMYAPNHTTSVTVKGPALGLETEYRPHFFGGVALIVTKLFNRVQPDIAVFGEKDYQQFLTIKHLTKDLDMPVRIIGAPIMREPDGLAMSSRNAYFDKQGRKIAGQLNVIMRACAKDIKNGSTIKTATDKAAQALREAGFESVDYVALADAGSLKLLSGKLRTKHARLLIAATCKGVRLIDNCGYER